MRDDTPAAEPLTLGLLGTGRMGRLVESLALERGHRVGLRLDIHNNEGGTGLTERALAGIDVLIDFSQPGAVLQNVRGAAAHKKNMVLGTTGWDRTPGAAEEARRLVEEAGTGLIFSPNFSLGMRLFRRVAEAAADLAAADREIDVWIEEAHHRGKADHPSGTALALAHALLARLPGKERIVTTLPAGPVAPSDLVVTAARGGSVPGEHRVLLDAAEESIELVHRVRSRSTFALGAVRAAEWVRGRSGFFTLDDMLQAREEEGSR